MGALAWVSENRPCSAVPMEGRDRSNNVIFWKGRHLTCSFLSARWRPPVFST